ncbi:failed axon connections isoform X1 [Drosophila biarmipes]|uniref:failed axon connections isoform X1 n=1 Tax=Drosophila biarmipes TaxID=125945 RepID=UPI0007E7BBEA|nr:failed axon connections isoform X1 [Drosophila biarmipes]
MASEVAQIPAEETPAVAAAEKPEEPEKPAAQPADSAAAPAAAPAVEKASEDGEADKKDEAGKQEKQQDGEEPKKEEPAAAAVAAKSEASPAQKFNVHKTNFEKDIIYLYQFSRTPLLPSLSPYCLKVETWLRLVGLKYENVDHKMRFRSKKGQLPFIELNGEEIADSAIIIKELSSKYEKNLDSGLTAEQRNVSYATIAMLENHLIWIIFYWRAKYPDNVLKGYKVNLQHALGLRLPNSILNFFFKITFGRKWFQGTKKLKAHGIGVHSAEEIEEFGKNDLKVLSEMLDCKPFFFGDEPTTLDVVAFAVLSQLHYLSKDIAYPLRDYMTEKCPNLIGHVSRMKDKCFPDWDEICTKLDLNAHIPKPEPETKEGKEGGEQEKSNEQEGTEGDKIEKELEKDKSNEKESTEENKEKEETK